jgi:hypothetical protein
MMQVYKEWIEQLSEDRDHVTTESQRIEYNEWIEWLELQQSNNRTRDIWVHHWRLEGVEHGKRSLDYILAALQKEDGVYPDLDEEEGPKNLDHLDL